MISDVLVIRDDFIKTHPDAIKALIQTWGKALDYYNANTTEGRAIISKAVGTTPEDLNTAFDGVKYFTLSDNKALLAHDFTTKTFPIFLKQQLLRALSRSPLQLNKPSILVSQMRNNHIKDLSADFISGEDLHTEEL